MPPIIVFYISMLREDSIGCNKWVSLFLLTLSSSAGLFFSYLAAQIFSAFWIVFVLEIILFGLLYNLWFLINREKNV